MSNHPDDDELLELALQAFRNPPLSYYDHMDEVLARMRRSESRAHRSARTRLHVVRGDPEGGGVDEGQRS